MNLDKEISKINIELNQNPNSQYLKDLKANLLNKKSLQLSQQSKYSDAIKFINQALELNSIHNVTLLCNKANFLHQLKKYNESIECSYEILTIDSTNSKAKDLIVLNLNTLQIIDSEKGNDQEALNKIDKALEIKPNDKYLLYNKASIFYKLEKFEETLEFVNKSLALDESFPTAKILKSAILNKKALIECDKKNFDEALIQVNMAIELNPKEVSYLVNKSSIYAHLKMYAEALEWCEKGLQIDKTNKEALALKNISIKHLKK